MVALLFRNSGSNPYCIAHQDHIALFDLIKTGYIGADLKRLRFTIIELKRYFSFLIVDR